MLKNKVIIIIGANGLLGGEFLKISLKNGAKVVASDIVDELGFTIRDLGFGGHYFRYKKCDITNKKSILDVIDFSKEIFSKIDAVVNTTYPRNKNYGKKFEYVEYNHYDNDD